MAKLVKNFLGQIGGMAARVVGAGGDSELDSVDGEQETETRYTRLKNSPVDSKLSLSSEEDSHLNEDDMEEVTECSTLKRGTLHKWTNYLHGWQQRFFAVGEGVLCYYKSEFDIQFGCRGSVSLHKVKILLHEFDELRFDVRAHDCTYFLRAATVDEKEAWVEAIEANKKKLIDSTFDTTAIRRQGSILSLSGLSQASTSSFKMGHDLQTKLAELDTYRDILCRQVDTLQAYFDALAENHSSGNGHSSDMQNGICNSAESLDELPEENGTSSDTEAPPSHLNQSSETKPTPTGSSGSSGIGHHSPLPNRFQPKGHRRTGSDPFSFRQHIPVTHRSNSFYHSRTLPPHFAIGNSSVPSSPLGPIDINNIDFRGEAITFKATTAGILASLSNCIELMTKREEYLQKKFEKEQERRRKAELAAHSAMNGQRVKAFEYAGPDFEEGPHSALNEEEFFDALEMAYQNDEIDPVQVLPSGEGEAEASDMAINTDDDSPPEVIVHKSTSGVVHRLTPLIYEKVSQYAKYIFEPVDVNWSVTYEDGEMKVYRRELEEDGVVVDPLKSYYMANGISAHEVISYFFDKETRLEWEGTLESVDVVEMLAEDSIIFHQLHKRVWPSTQRETLFCSHLCTLPNAPRPENMVGHTWMVCNFSIDHDSIPPTSKLIRATLHIGMVCQTIANKPVEPGKEAELTRDDITCKIIYAANVNPGGWAPPSVVRTIGKRELTKFLRKFSSTVQRQTASSPLTL